MSRRNVFLVVFYVAFMFVNRLFWMPKDSLLHDVIFALVSGAVMIVLLSVYLRYGRRKKKSDNINSDL